MSRSTVCVRGQAYIVDATTAFVYTPRPTPMARRPDASTAGDVMEQIAYAYTILSRSRSRFIDAALQGTQWVGKIIFS